MQRIAPDPLKNVVRSFHSEMIHYLVVVCLAKTVGKIKLLVQGVGASDLCVEDDRAPKPRPLHRGSQLGPGGNEFFG
jgi:hypothetical protein